MRNPLTKEAFAEWCEKQPADKEYSWFGCATCACGQYAASLGMSGDEWFEAAKSKRTGFWANANWEAMGGPWTFHRLAQRLRA